MAAMIRGSIVLLRFCSVVGWWECLWFGVVGLQELFHDDLLSTRIADQVHGPAVTS